MQKIKNTSKKQQAIFQLLLLIAIILVANVVIAYFPYRYDLTKEKRFSLTNATKNLLRNIDDVVYIKIYLEGEFPSGFKRLQNSTKEIINEFRAYSGNNIEYEFIDALADKKGKERQAIIDELTEKGIEPIRLVENAEEYSEKIIFPGAMVSYKGRELPLILLQQQLNKPAQETLNNSIALLEYNFANAIQKLKQEHKPALAFLTGHGELNKNDLEDLASWLSKYYIIQQFDISNELEIPQKYDAIVLAKPTQKFDEKDKYKIDQYIIHGGKALFVYENMNTNMDSLQNKNGSFIALDYGLNIEDMLFRYGARVNFDLVQDLQCAKIPLVVGADKYGNAQQTQLFPWVYFPIINTVNNNHPVTKNLDAVLLQFAATIDTIQTKQKNIKKTVLLSTSKYSRTLQAPIQVDVNSVRKNIDPKQYNGGSKPIAVALEGSFESLFKNRLSFSTKELVDTLQQLPFAEKSTKATKMIIIADGDILRNDYDANTNKISPLGYYKFTKETFANKEFITNAIDWLTDENGIIEARSKDIKLRLLDAQKIKANKLTWQLINIVLPIVFIILFGIIFNYWRKKKFAI